MSDPLVRVLAETLPDWLDHMDGGRGSRIRFARRQVAALRAHFVSEEVRERLAEVVAEQWSPYESVPRLLAVLGLTEPETSDV